MADDDMIPRYQMAGAFQEKKAVVPPVRPRQSDDVEMGVCDWSEWFRAQNSMFSRGYCLFSNRNFDMFFAQKKYIILFYFNFNFR